MYMQIHVARLESVYRIVILCTGFVLNLNAVEFVKNYLKVLKFLALVYGYFSDIV
jgi:hypothetical protein